MSSGVSEIGEDTRAGPGAMLDVSSTVRVEGCCGISLVGFLGLEREAATPSEEEAMREAADQRQCIWPQPMMMRLHVTDSHGLRSIVE